MYAKVWELIIIKKNRNKCLPDTHSHKNNHKLTANLDINAYGGENVTVVTCILLSDDMNVVLEILSSSFYHNPLQETYMIIMSLQYLLYVKYTQASLYI